MIPKSRILVGHTLDNSELVDLSVLTSTLNVLEAEVFDAVSSPIGMTRRIGYETASPDLLISYLNMAADRHIRDIKQD